MNSVNQKGAVIANTLVWRNKDDTQNGEKIYTMTNGNICIAKIIYFISKPKMGVVEFETFDFKKADITCLKIFCIRRSNGEICVSDGGSS